MVFFVFCILSGRSRFFFFSLTIDCVFFFRYNNITFEQLGTLLNVTSQEAEKVCSRMIGQVRLSGVIDQVDGVLYFGSSTEGTPLIDWDGQIGYICTEMNQIMEKITKDAGN